MVEVAASDGFLEVLAALAADEKLSSEERGLITADMQTKHITLQSFRCLHKYHPEINIHNNIRGCRMTRPYQCKIQESNDKEAANQRLAKRKAYLQRQHETREYNRMVYGSERILSDNEETISSAIQSVKYQAAISSNMLAAVSTF